jgi:hypothetical protein
MEANLSDLSNADAVIPGASVIELTPKYPRTHMASMG